MMVPESREKMFLKALMSNLKQMFKIDPSNPETQKFNPEVGSLITAQTLERMKNLINTSQGKILVGGVSTIDTENRYLSPTIILNPSLDADISKHEIFGPILPIYTYKDFKDMVVNTIAKGEKPLAIYYGGNPHSRNFKFVVDNTSSGNVTANDVMTHTTETELGFGGVGLSGQGRVGGYESFKQFSNPKGIVQRYQTNFFPYNWVSPPYNNQKQAVVRTLLGLLGVKQNNLFGNIIKLIAVILLYMVVFGKLGQSRFRKECYQGLINVLKQYA